MKWMIIITAVIVVGIILVPVVVTQIESAQARATAKFPFKAISNKQSTEPTAVVYFSRSGNTRLAAQYLADQLKADLFSLTADDYPLGVRGWINSLRDARGHRATLSSPAIDLSKYRTVYLGSPIWLYSPAPPIWEFVSKQRFDGKRVVLFNTYNSTFESRFIEEFKASVLKQGAVAFEHRAVRRGRMGQQVSPSEMLKKIDAWELVPTQDSEDKQEGPR